MLINYNGRLNSAIAKQVKQARKASFSLSRKVKNLRLPIDTHIELFHKVVLPVLLYGCEVWGYEDLEHVEVFYRNFLKRITGMKSFTPNCIVYAETGTLNIKRLVYLRMCSYWCRILNGSTHKLSYILYKVTRNLHYREETPYRSLWIEKMQNIFDQAGMTSIWDFEMEGQSKTYVVNSLKLRLNDIAKQNLWAEINENSMCDNYRIFKNNIDLEEYLVKLNFHDSRILTKFRCRGHRLPITANRFDKDKNTRRHLTFCTKCNGNELGDEIHYLCKCPFFDEERKKYLGKSRFPNPSVFSVRKIIDCEVNPSNFIKFIELIMSTFENDLENISDYNYVYKPYTTRSGREVRRPIILDV